MNKVFILDLKFPETEKLEKLLNEGYKIVTSNSTSGANFDRSYNYGFIVYILNK